MNEGGAQAEPLHSPISLRVSRLISNAGNEVALPITGVTCIVGANNVGKSQLLADVKRYLYQTPDGNPVVLRSIETVPSLPLFDPTFITYGLGEDGVSTELLDFLKARAGATWLDQSGTPLYAPRGGGQGATARQIQSSLTQTRLDQYAAPWFIAEGALGSSVNFQGSYGSMGTNEQDASMMSMLMNSWEVEQEVSSIHQEAFGLRLVFDSVANGGLRLGEDDKSLLQGHRPTREYREHIARLPKLSQQGQGVQAYMGIAVTTALSEADIFLFDEPETYLHPPQARALGRILGQRATLREAQIILVTHSRDLIVGLLESGCDLNFVRVTRNEEGNELHHVDTKAIAYVWNSAVLRYSNVLDGLFYRRVIVCEAEPDCRFYAAVNDGLVEDGVLGVRESESLFLGASGKGGAVKRIEALASLGCNIQVILDVDALSDGPSLLRNIVRALGREWVATWSDAVNEISSAVKTHNLKESFQRAGLKVLPDGRLRKKAADLIASLTNEGVHILPGGTLEAFYPETSQEKERWVDQVLSEGRHKTLEEPREFVQRLVSGKVE